LDVAESVGVARAPALPLKQRVPASSAASFQVKPDVELTTWGKKKRKSSSCNIRGATAAGATLLAKPTLH
jgi:hypothetical protein